LEKAKSLGPEHTGVDCMSMTTIFSKKIQTYMASGFMTNEYAPAEGRQVLLPGCRSLGDCICGSRAKILCETMPGWF